MAIDRFRRWIILSHLHHWFIADASKHVFEHVQSKRLPRDVKRWGGSTCTPACAGFVCVAEMDSGFSAHKTAQARVPVLPFSGVYRGVFFSLSNSWPEKTEHQPDNACRDHDEH